MHRDERRSTTTKRVRETEAEAVAFFVCSAVGLETGTAAQDYIGLYGGDAKLLNESLEYVQRTATEILNAIRRMILHPRHPPKNGRTPRHAIRTRLPSSIFYSAQNWQLPFFSISKKPGLFSPYLRCDSISKQSLGNK